MSFHGPSDYDAIRQDHKRRYGTDIAEFGPRLFDEQYADPRHFLLELLQNAEDALARRATKPHVTERGVSFDLTADALHVSHCGDPFNPADVKSICGIGKSTKSLENIGRFGLGFKSVYAFTDRPEIHSGPEDFAIESYVWPKAVEGVARKKHETVIVIPRTVGRADFGALRDGFRTMLSASNLLFLRHIESVRWSAPDGSRAEYLRESKEVAPEVRHVTIFGGADGATSCIDEEWLIFYRPVRDGERAVGRVEIAFLLDSAASNRAGQFPIRRLTKSLLYAYFPTDKDTHLGFRVQGPYNTTPARDNVKEPELNSWNRYLVSETASLLRSALSWFRDRRDVTVALLNCLPLDEDQFMETMFLPLFEESKTALREDGLLPADSGSLVSAPRARLGRGKDLRNLFTSDQLGELCGIEGSVHWLLGEITAARTPGLHRYLQEQLEVEELDPESVVNRLTGEFLIRRSDAWILHLYEFLADQAGFSLRRSLRKKPILRLDDGQQVRPPQEDDRGVFFPGEAATGFRTVRESVCKGEKARRFLEGLGIGEPDLVADVIENVLPKYDSDTLQIAAQEYQADLDRIAHAYETDSLQARSRLLEALRRTRWVQSVDGTGRDAGWRSPEELYLATPLLLRIFDGIESVRFVRQEAFPEALLSSGRLLDQCGVARVLKPSKVVLEGRRLSEIGSKLRGGALATTHRGHDWAIEGLADVFGEITRDTADARVERPRSLWDALREAWAVSARNDDASSYWTGKYHWSYSHSRLFKTFDAAFVEALRQTEWVADSDGTLNRPNEVVFSSLGWSDEPALREKLGFLSDDDKRNHEQAEVLTELEERWGIRTLDELHARLDGVLGSPTPEPTPAQKLSEVVEWWSGVKAEERHRYRKEAYPSILDPSSLEDTNRVGWFTMFALACFQSYGRTRDGQHRGFVDSGVRAMWWEDLANSSPPEDVNAWLERLNAWSDVDHPSQQFRMWRGSFLALYTVARYMDEYIRLMQKLPDIVEEEGPLSLQEVLDPTHSPAVRKLGVDAAPLAQTLGIGVNWMIRELLRAGLYERGGVMVPYAWMSSRRVREFLRQAGGPSLDEANPDHSGQIYEFVVEELGREVAEFDGDYDLPLQLWTMQGRK